MGICVSLEPDTPSSNGKGNEGDEGDEGHEEEDREQDCEGQACQGNGAPRDQGEDHWRLAGKGPYQEQVWQDWEQEGQRCQEEQPLDRCRQEGPCRLEDQGVLCNQEGHTPVPEGKGVLQVSALLQMSAAAGCGRHQLRLWGFPRPLSAGAPSSEHR